MAAGVPPFLFAVLTLLGERNWCLRGRLSRLRDAYLERARASAPARSTRENEVPAR